MALNLFGTKKDTKPKADAQPEVQAASPEVSVPQQVHVTGPSVLRRMHVSEKSSRGQAMGQYTFIVDSSARKPEIAKAVEAQYGVKVAAVKIINLPSKSRRVGRYFGTKAGISKAVIVLKKGHTIATG